VTRYRITVEYDGSGFVGWQRQANGPSIQAAIEAAILGFSGESVTVYGAGRTDAGVHARGQVAHFDLAKRTTARTIANALNAHLRPAPIAVVQAAEAAADFDARLSARRRTYLYRIVNRRAALALDYGRAWHVAVALDAEAMHAAAQRLVGRHDFTTFRAALCQARSPVKTLDRLDVVRDGEEVLVHAEARSFLHHQVRNMVGTLKLVGEAKWTDEDVSAALEARDRRSGGPTAPPEGLYLIAVRYAEER
jgi:tRNA pseudouridine38-40 synthase